MELEALCDGEGNVQWGTFYREMCRNSSQLKQFSGHASTMSDTEWVLKITLGAHLNEKLLHVNKLCVVTSLFGSLVKDDGVRRMLRFYRNKVSGRRATPLDKSIG